MGSATSEFLAALRQGCDGCQLRHTRVLVAVSGGADSVSLLLGLWLLREELQLTLHVGHLNHQLRAAESDADADWVSDLCRARSIPCHLGAAAVATSPQLSKLGLEGAARLARRDFLQRVALEHQCAGIAVAHTADDQAETILHHIIRGTGLGGLRGMHADTVLNSTAPHALSKPVPIVRPLLQAGRSMVIQFLHEQDQAYRIDASNSDTSLTRNRIRHELLPLLARDFNPQIQQALLKLGQQAQEVYADEQRHASDLLQAALVEATAGHCRLRCEPFRGQSPQRIRECFVQLWRQQNWPRRQMGFADWGRLVEILEAQHPAITLPGNITARRREDLLMLTKNATVE